jgi:hypothetical protein
VHLFNVSLHPFPMKDLSRRNFIRATSLLAATATPSLYATTVPQTRTSPDIDQSHSDDREERQWDQTPRYWSDTPLGQWAIEANRWDGVDPIPPDGETVFYAD